MTALGAGHQYRIDEIEGQLRRHRFYGLSYAQVLHAVRDHALAAPESLAEDALVLRAKVRARLGLDGEWSVVEES